MSFRYPQILLLGNGLNRTVDGDSWSDLIKELGTKKGILLDNIGSVPFPLQVVLVTEDGVAEAIKDKLDRFYGLKAIDEIYGQLTSLLNCGFDAILTTNYSYELERAAESSIKRDGRNCVKHLEHSESVTRAEPKYMLHSYYAFNSGDHENKIWHIHGEARKPDSIIIGHYYYGKLLGKIFSLLENRNNKQYKRQVEKKPPIIDSWVDSFIMGDVYVFGFGFDLSEMDLWWLLSRKKNEKAAHGI